CWGLSLQALRLLAEPLPALHQLQELLVHLLLLGVEGAVLLVVAGVGLQLRLLVLDGRLQLVDLPLDDGQLLPGGLLGPAPLGGGGLLRLFRRLLRSEERRVGQERGSRVSRTRETLEEGG